MNAIKGQASEDDVDEVDSLPEASGRWMSVGHSLHPDAHSAGVQASSQALQGRTATVLFVFSHPHIEIAPMLAGLRSVTAEETVVAGCTTGGEIAPITTDEGRPGVDPSVVVVAIGGPGFEAFCVADQDVSRHRRESGATVVAAMSRLTHPHRVLLMLTDGLSGEQHEIIRGAYAELGASVPIVGGCAADDLRVQKTYQFHGTGAAIEVLSDGVVGVALGSTSPLGAGIAHGWRKTGDAMVVTSSEGGRVDLLDGEPAARMYWSRVTPDGATWEDVPRLRQDDPTAFQEILFRNPLGLSRRSGEDLRTLYDIDVESGSILCLADVPQGAVAWTMTTDADALIEAAAVSCSSALEAVDGQDPLGFLIFDCAARKLQLGEEGLRAEQAAIGKIGGEKPFGGFYTYGEIGRLRGARGLHQLTVVTLAVT